MVHDSLRDLAAKARPRAREELAELRRFATETLKIDNLEPWDITRRNEPAAAELGMAGWPKDAGSPRRWIAALAARPELIQRPIITADDGTTVVGRSPEALAEIIGRAAR